MRSQSHRCANQISADLEVDFIQSSSLDWIINIRLCFLRDSVVRKKLIESVVNEIKITGDFDGGNPKDHDFIINNGYNSFTIIPFSEDNDPNYKFRLDVNVYNPYSETVYLNLTIDWLEIKFSNLRNYVYIKNEKEKYWNYFPMEVSDSKSIGNIPIDPGNSHICLHPKYNYQDYLKYIKEINETKILNKSLIGITQEGREIWMIRISRSPVKKKKILIVGRIHPYETAANYCIDGIIEYFHKDFSEEAFNFLKNSEIYLIPMANPDGVYNGLCKLSHYNGIDLSKNLDEKDSTSSILKSAIDLIEPHVYCEIHNWMLQEFDGLYFLNFIKSKKLIRSIPEQIQFDKNWKIHLRKKILSFRPDGFKKYCKEKFKSTVVVIEYPWHNRNVDDMKKLGISTCKALATV